MMMIIEVPESTDFDAMPEDLKAAIARYNGQFPERTMVGTQPVNGFKLVFIYVEATPAEVEQLTNNNLFDDDGVQIAFDLGWTVLASEDQIVDQSLLLPYFMDVPTMEFNESDELVQTGSEPVTDLTDKLQVWAGKKWLYS